MLMLQLRGLGALVVEYILSIPTWSHLNSNYFTNVLEDGWV